MKATTYLIAALFVGVATPLASSQDALECYVVTTSNAIVFGEFYVRGTLGEIWEETNGLDGLQRRDSGCSDGRVIPSDTCYYMGLDGAVRCSADTASQL